MLDKRTETVLTAKQEADQLHMQIVTAGNMAAVAIVEMARCLKRMRDARLYIERGFDTFEDYVENDVDIGKRHAYNYIHVYEQLGDTALQSNAQLGITKLELLARLPIAERQELLEDPRTADETVTQLKARIAELTAQTEQMSLLSDENERLRAELEASTSSTSEELAIVEDFKRENDWLQKKVDELEAKVSEAEYRVAKAREKLKKAKENPKIPDAMMAKVKEEAAAEAQKEVEERLAEDLKKAETAAAEAEKELREARREREDMKERLEDAERRLKTAAPEVAAFKTLFENAQRLVSQMKANIAALRDTDPATADNLQKALCAFADMLRGG